MFLLLLTCVGFWFGGFVCLFVWTRACGDDNYFSFYGVIGCSVEGA